MIELVPRVHVRDPVVRAQLARDLEARYRVLGSMRAVADECGRSYSFVWRLFDEQGVAPCERPDRSAEVARLVELYAEHGQVLLAARAAGMDRRRAARWLRKAGVPIAPRGRRPVER